MTLQAWDADGHVNEWEGIFADRYLEPKFRERRPRVVPAGEAGTCFTRDIPAVALPRR